MLPPTWTAMADRSLNRPPHDIRARPVCQFFLKTAERRLLFLIPILHQTTTIASWATTAGWLFLIPILHQTTTSLMTTSTLSTLFLIPILHQTTTCWYAIVPFPLLFLIPILHQTTTPSAEQEIEDMLFLIPILHQTTTSSGLGADAARVVSHSNSTSNHNDY